MVPNWRDPLSVLRPVCLFEVVGLKRPYVRKYKVFYHLNSKQVMILKYTIIYITMKELQNAQPCLLSNYFTMKGAS